MKLGVWSGSHLIGWLSHEGTTNRFAFEYAPSWLALAEAFPLSPALPFQAPKTQTPDAHSAVVRQFFENLLPEGQALDDAANAYAVSKANVAGLLAVLGRETAGALCLKADTGVPYELAPPVRRPLTHMEISERIRARNQIPFSVWDGKVRLSIAGFQDKLAVLEEAGQWFLVEGDQLASTHILKPEPANPLLAGLTSNEFFCMRLAEAVRLPVASVNLHKVPEPLLAVVRFDRRIESGQVRRLPAIDGCQALGLSAAYKYERPYGDGPDVRDIRDGASLPKLFDLVDTFPRPAAERRALLRWAIFQVLIGNTDAHAKNLTFMQQPGGLTLAKAYDLVCGRLYNSDHLDSTYAMAVGDAFEAQDVSALEWATLCLRCQQLPPALVCKELEQLAADVKAQLNSVATAVIADGANPDVVTQVIGAIEPECNRQMEMAKLILALYKSEKANS